MLGGACGRLGFDQTAGGGSDSGSGSGSDGGIDAPPCVLGSWGPLRPQTALNTTGNDWEATIHEGGLVMVFARQASMDSNLFVATRASTLDDFSSPVPIAAATTGGYEYGAAWSPDGQRLYFRYDSSLPTTSEVRVVDYLGGTSFSSTFTVANLPPGSFSWEFTPDDLEVFYTIAATTNDYDLYHATRATTGAPWVVDGALDGLHRSGAGLDEGWPTFDPARQALYIERDGVLALTTRSGPEASFGAPQAVPGIVPANDGDPDLSDDGKTLVFASDRNGGSSQADLFLTTRSCL